jgi:hypothetical protein
MNFAADYQLVGDYYHGNYLGAQIILNIRTGYVNGTTLCAWTSGWSIDDWLVTEAAQRLMAAIKPAEPIVEVIDFDKLVNGTCIHPTAAVGHPKLLPALGAWASPQIALGLARVVEDHLARERDQVYS